MDTLHDFEYIAKPFGTAMSPDRQLKFLSEFSWLELARLDGFAEEAAAILKRNPNMPAAHIQQIMRGINWQIEKLMRFMASK